MKILLAYDGKAVSQRALETAQKHATAFEASVSIVTSLETGTEKDLKEIERAEQDLQAVKKRVESNGIPCKTHLLIRGLLPGEDLVQFAREENVDEMIIGISKKSKVGKLVFGSTAQHVILKAPCPVLTVK